VPKNEGNESSSPKLEKLNTVKVFELELSNMEGSPTYAITHQITVGREIGNIVVSDPSISPRHCTFVLQQEVISLIDHGSVSGTFVNEKRIPSGRYIILEGSDTIHVGDLEINIKLRHEALPMEETADEEEDEELLDEAEVEDVVEDEESDEVDSEIEEGDEYEDLSEEDEIVPEELEVVPAPKNGIAGLSANTLVRITAIIGDVLIAYGILVIFLPFDDFQAFLGFIPQQMSDLLGVSLTSFWEVIRQDFGFIGQLMDDFSQFLSKTLHIGPVLLIFILIRLISTLILGVSLTEFFLNVRGRGHFLWKRIGGGLRVLIGVFTGPFLIFDLPAIISRRTFKEVLTYTNIFTSSKLATLFGALFFIPLTLVFALISPLFQGLEFEESVVVEDKLEQRVRVQKDLAEGEEGISELMASSDFLNLAFSYNLEEVTVMPVFKIQGVQRQLNYKSQILFYFNDIQRVARIELMKKFDLQQLLGIGLRGNLFLYEDFPEIHSFLYQTKNQAFQPSTGKKSQNAFANELMVFNKLALETSVETAFEVMQSHTPLLKSLIDYKQSLLSLIEYKDFNNVGFIKIGDAIFLKFSYIKQRPFDLLIPLIKGEGKIYRVDFDKNEALSSVSTKLYKFTLNSANWISAQKTTQLDTFSPLQVIDVFSQIDPEKVKINPDSAQAIYGYYYEASAAILKNFDETRYSAWKRSVSSTFKVIERLNENRAVEVGEEDSLEKLHQNFKDLLDAVENKNFEYFGISESISI
jgi:pSer/pThr/pTyr-binding forkhead associated (FHA) protein